MGMSAARACPVNAAVAASAIANFFMFNSPNFSFELGWLDQGAAAPIPEDQSGNYTQFGSECCCGENTLA
jgi:hypothetical protein